MEPDNAFQLGEAVWEYADLPECQIHIDVPREVDERLGLREPGEEKQERHEEIMRAAGEVLSRLLVFCWRKPNGEVRTLTEALKRFVAASCCLRSDLMGDRDYHTLAGRLRCTRACLSKVGLEFADEVGLHFRNQRRQSARKTFSDAQRRAHRRRKTKRPATK